MPEAQASGGNGTARAEGGAQRGAGRAPARERAERGTQLRGTRAKNAESGCGGRAREEDREHRAAATGATSGRRADATRYAPPDRHFGVNRLAFAKKRAKRRRRLALSLGMAWHAESKGRVH